MITDFLFVGNVTMFEAYFNSTELLENPVFTNESCTTDGGGGTCEFGLQNSFQVWSDMFRSFLM